jgi:hypothetical protein
VYSYNRNGEKQYICKKCKATTGDTAKEVKVTPKEVEVEEEKE